MFEREMGGETDRMRKELTSVEHLCTTNRFTIEFYSKALIIRILQIIPQYLSNLLKNLILNIQINK